MPTTDKKKIVCIGFRIIRVFQASSEVFESGRVLYFCLSLRSCVCVSACACALEVIKYKMAIKFYEANISDYKKKTLLRSMEKV